ncbi:MAG TPA: hypothetical protein ENK44_05740 [Caldithrix abyssi]|uniref:Hydrolase n=1 Tax=Caldithrix abyssi TaxID=187145 RepID=A0A7V4UCZ5_CALAY|nr:hypothetical protein [Caldithrix abyssi]
MKFKYFLLFIFLGIHIVSAQVSQPNQITALRIESKIEIDGNLDEPQWNKAIKISNFTQRELEEGKPVTEDTRVAILYDDRNLYIGVWCYDSNPDGIIARKMKRDFRWGGDDNFEIIIDTYHNHRDGYLFVTNPNGSRADALIQDNGKYSNKSWDGVWDVRARITEEGWFAEFEIPFSTLKFSQKEEQVWGINFERNIRRKREQVMWQGWSRDSELEQVSRAGILKGLRGLQSVDLLEVKPYLIGGWQNKVDAEGKTTFNAGGDINYLITPTVKLNITLNTDFAQVESDLTRINLSRFSLYYPEKREFFLESKDYFDFGMGRRIQPFYSRRIGISPDRHEIPIIAGARILGKQGKTTLGAMSIQTAAKDSIPTTNFSVLRWRQDVGDQSGIGLIGVAKLEHSRQNGVLGGDFIYSTDRLFGDKNLRLGGAYALSYTSDIENKTGEAQRIYLSMPNDFIEFDAAWERSQKDFNPEVGFLRRENYQLFYTELQFNPRPKFLPFMRQLVVKPLDINYYLNDQTGELISFESEFRPLGFSTKSGEFFEFNIQRNAENLTEPFPIHEDVTIPTGEYWFTRYEIQAHTFSGRPLFGFGEINWGEFYKGRRTRLQLFLVYRMNKYVSFSVNAKQNDIDLPEGAFITREYSGRMEYAFNPNLFGSVFGQWNSEDREVLFNFRLNWIPKPGADLYFVVNQSFDTQGGYWRGTNTAVLSKLVWRFEI